MSSVQVAANLHRVAEDEVLNFALHPAPGEALPPALAVVVHLHRPPRLPPAAHARRYLCLAPPVPAHWRFVHLPDLLRPKALADLRNALQQLRRVKTWAAEGITLS